MSSKPKTLSGARFVALRNPSSDTAAATGVATISLFRPGAVTQLRALVPLLHRRVAWLMAVLAVPFLAAVVPLLAVRFAQGGDALRINLWRSAAAIFLRDPLTAHPHEPDVQALLKVCDVHDVPLATNVASAKLLLERLGELRP